MEDKLKQLQLENEKLKQQNERLVNEIELCHKELGAQISVLNSVKTEMRRYEVQLDTFKAQNAELKHRFDVIENNPICKILLQLYRNLREIKHRLIDRRYK